MVAKRKGKGAAATSAAIDLRDASQLPAFNDLISKHNLTIVLVYADYCGHCHTYKDQIWSKLTALPNRKAGLASVHYDQLENTPLANAKISGYPSVILIGKDKVPAEFEEEGSVTNAFPDARNEPLMEKLLTEEPQEVVPSLPNMKKAPNINLSTTTAEENALLPSAETEEVRNLGNASLNETGLSTETTMPVGPVAAPNVAEDVLNSQTKQNQSMEFEYTPAKTNELPKPGKGVAVGGSLYQSMLEAAATAGPAIALSTAATMARGRRRARKTKRGGGKGRGGSRRGRRRTTRKN